jgi:hypothetical protein
MNQTQRTSEIVSECAIDLGVEEVGDGPALMLAVAVVHTRDL